MSKRLLSIFLIYFFSTTISYAQELSKNEQEIDKKAFIEIDKKNYKEALPLFSQLLSLHPKDVAYNFNYAVCLIETNEDPEKALSFLKYVARNSQDPILYYYLGKAYHLNYLFDKALLNYKFFQSHAKKSDLKEYDVVQLIRMAENGKELVNYVTQLHILQNKKIKDDKFYYSYDLDGIGGKLIITPPDFKTKIDKKKKYRGITFMRGDTLAFYASYGNDKHGSLDLYIRHRDENYNWSEPQSLGPIVNTSYDENYPYLAPNGTTLYFSSKGHNSMGGYDIFRIEYDIANNKSIDMEPTNMDFPINSPYDDLLYITDKADKFAFFSSKRETGKDKIAVYKILVEKNPKRRKTKGLDDILKQAKMEPNVKEAKKETNVIAENNTTNAEANKQNAKNKISFTPINTNNTTIELLKKTVDEDIAVLEKDLKKSAKEAVVLYKSSNDALEKAKKQNQIIESLKEKIKTADATRKPILERQLIREQNDAFLARNNAINQHHLYEQIVASQALKKKDMEALRSFKASIKNISSDTEIKAKLNELQSLRTKIESNRNKYPSTEESLAQTKAETTKDNAKLLEINKKIAENKTALEELITKTNVLKQEIKEAKNGGDQYIIEKKQKQFNNLKKEYSKLLNQQKQLTAKEVYYDQQVKINNSEIALIESLPEKTKTVTIENPVQPINKNEAEIFAKSIKTAEADADLDLNNYTAEVIKKETKTLPPEEELFPKEELAQNTPISNPAVSTNTSTSSTTASANTNNNTVRNNQPANNNATQPAPKTTTLASAKNNPSQTTNNTVATPSVSPQEINTLTSQIEEKKQQLKTIKNKTKASQIQQDIKNLETTQKLLSAEKSIQNDPVIVSMNQQIQEKEIALKSASTPSEKQQLKQDINNLKQIQNKLVADAITKQLDNQPVDKQKLALSINNQIADKRKTLKKSKNSAQKSKLTSEINDLEKISNNLTKSIEPQQVAEANSQNDILTKELNIVPSDNSVRKYEKTMLKKTLIENRIEENQKRLAQLQKIKTPQPVPELQQQIKTLQNKITTDKEEIAQTNSQLSVYKQQAASELGNNSQVNSDNNILTALSTYKPKNNIKPIDDVNEAQRVSELSTKASKNKTLTKSLEYQLDDLKKQYQASDNPEIKAKIDKLTKEKERKRAAYISQENLANILSFNALSDKLLNIESNHPEWHSQKASSLIAEGDYYANLAQRIQKNTKNIKSPEIKKQEEEKALTLQKIAIAKKTQALDIYTDVSHGKVNKSDDDEYYDLPEIVLSNEDEEALDNADDLNYLSRTLKDEIASLESKAEDIRNEREKTLDTKKQKKLDKKLQKLNQIIDDKRIEEQGYHIMAGKTEKAINDKYIDTLLLKHGQDPVVELCMRQVNLYSDAILKTNDEIKKESDSEKKQKLYSKLENEYDELITAQRSIINKLLKRQPQPFLAARALNRINPLSELNRRLSMGKLPEFDRNALYQQLQLTENERKDLDYATKLETEFLSDKNKAWEVEQKIVATKDKLKTTTNPKEKEKLQNELDKLNQKKMTILTAVYDNYEPVNFTRHEVLRRQLRKFRTNLSTDAKLKIKQLEIRSQQKFKRATNLRDASFMADNDDDVYNDLQKTVALEKSSIQDLEKALAIATNLIQSNKKPVLASKKPVNTDNIIIQNTGAVKSVETPPFDKKNITYTYPKTLEKGKMKDLIININNTSNYRNLVIVKLTLPKAIVAPSISTQAKTKKEQGLITLSWDKMPMADVAKISLMPIAGFSGSLKLTFNYIGRDNQIKEFSYSLPVETTGFMIAANNNVNESSNLIAQNSTPVTNKKSPVTVTENTNSPTSSLPNTIKSTQSDNTKNTINTTNSKQETSTTDNNLVDNSSLTTTKTNTPVQKTTQTQTPTSTATTTNSNKTTYATSNSNNNSASVGSKIFSNLSVPAYNNSNPIPINSEWPEGLIFKIQIGAFAKPVQNDAFGGLNPLSAELRTTSRWYRYFVGQFKSYEGARAALPQVKNLGYRDAFIVAYLNGKRIPLYKGRSKTKQIDNYNAIAQQEISELTGNTSSLPTETQTTQQPIATDNTIGNTQSIKNYKDLLYTVQVGVFKTSPKTSYFRGLSPIYQEKTPYGFVRYFTGIFNDYKNAIAERDRIIALGISDAFVAIYNNGKRISLNEAQLLERSGKKKVSSVAPIKYPEAPIAPPTKELDKNTIWFSVQVGAYKEQVPLDVTQNLIKISRNNEIKQLKDERGYTLFLVGNFKSYAKAKSFSLILKNDGITDAFIAAFANDKKVPLDRAKTLLP